MTWYRLALSAEQLVAGGLERRRDQFEKAFKTAGSPRTVALFQKAGQDGGLELFFTPDCAEHVSALLEEWDCFPCERPGMVGMELLVGFNEITYYLF